MRAKFVSIQVATGRGVAERYLSQYGKNGDWIKTSNGPSKDIYDRICDLGSNPPIDEVAEVIGNKSWSYISCDGCNDYVERAVRLGSGADYGGGKSYCKTCIEEAAQILIGEAK